MKSHTIVKLICLSMLLFLSLSFSVQAQNTPPDPPTGIVFVPVTPRANADLAAVILGGYDADGDPVTTICDWYVNDIFIVQDHVLPNGEISAGDLVTLEARFTDGAEASEPTSRSITIEAGGVVAPGVHFFTGNNHHYERQSALIEVYWENAREWAEQRYFLGVQGHLATVTDQEESDFITARFVDFPSRGMHISGFQPDGSIEPDGNWQWITGETWDFTNWAPGEPNNNGLGPEGFLAIAHITMWNDISAGDPHYL